MELTVNKVFIRQKVNPSELIGIEAKNRYAVLDENQRVLYYAYEESSFLARLFLKRYRKLKLNIVDQQKQSQLTLKKTFAFLKPTFYIEDPNGQNIGLIKLNYSFISAKFSIYDKNNNLRYFTKYRIKSPWTYKIYKNEEDFNNSSKTGSPELALITKKWAGLAKEFFTKADNFMVDFKNIKEKEDKTLILALAFAIELTLFEYK